MKQLTLLSIPFLFALSLVACAPGAAPTPTVDANALSTRIAANIFATQTASVPTATYTPMSTQTRTPTSTPLPTDTPPPTDTPTETPIPTNTPEPTVTFTPRPTRVPSTATPVAVIGKGVTSNLKGQWEITYIGEFRDKTLFFYDQGKTAFGVWVTIEFRVRNLQTGTDNIGRSFEFGAVDQSNNVSVDDFDASQNARWEYCGCATIWTDIAPGTETVAVVSFDVPESTTTLTVVATEGGVFNYQRLVPGERWVISNVNQIPAFKPKN